MSRGTEFLEMVSGKLRERLSEIDDVIVKGQQDIGKMNEYYWENYTEMDQYGYENFDNQQALLIQVNANQESLKKRHRLKKMMDSPFFGSVDFVYEGEEEPETFYIGIGNFAERSGSVPLIYDWRAPVSSLFYDYDQGPASYEAPAGVLDGTITSKWQYKIRDGRMIYEFESDMKIDDEILKQELGGNGDAQLKNIVRTIQKEQNAIIRNTQDRILVIQGVAGSGKTSVALHRIAYLLYHDRKNLKSSDILILSPNSVFSDYISHVLPELGEENIQEMSFDLFAYRELRSVAADCEDRYHYIEKRIRYTAPAKAQSGQSGKLDDTEKKNAAASGIVDESYEWKQSLACVQAMEGFLAELEDRLVDFADVEYRGFTKKASELLTMFYFKLPDIPMFSRMEELLERFIDEYETLTGRSLPEEETEKLREKFMRMYVTTDLYRIYSWFLEDNGFAALPDVPYEKRILEYEDVFPMLYLKYRLCRGTDRRKIKHLVIDEMQDYSYLQYVILERLFPCRMTILGDRAQTMDTKQQDVLKFFPKIFGKKVRCIEMNKSYRNTCEIARYAAQVSGAQAPDYLQRHGKGVEEAAFSVREEALDAVLEKAAASQGKYETIAVLTMTAEEAEASADYLRKSREDIWYIDRDSSSFKKGITVTTFYLAKGLEFDQVFILGGDRTNPFFTQFRYICATRALHELYVYDLENNLYRPC